MTPLTPHRRRALERKIRIANPHSRWPLREVGRGPHAYLCMAPDGMIAFRFQNEAERQAAQTAGMEAAHLTTDALTLIDTILAAAARARHGVRQSGTFVRVEHAALVTAPRVTASS